MARIIVENNERTGGKNRKNAQKEFRDSFWAFDWLPPPDSPMMVRCLFRNIPEWRSDEKPLIHSPSCKLFTRFMIVYKKYLLLQQIARWADSDETHLVWNDKNTHCQSIRSGSSGACLHRILETRGPIDTRSNLWTATPLFKPINGVRFFIFRPRKQLTVVYVTHHDS